MILALLLIRAPSVINFGLFYGYNSACQYPPWKIRNKS